MHKYNININKIKQIAKDYTDTESMNITKILNRPKDQLNQMSARTKGSELIPLEISKHIVWPLSMLLIHRSTRSVVVNWIAHQ